MINITSGPHFTLFLPLSPWLSPSASGNLLIACSPQRHLNWITRLIITILNHYRATISHVYLGQFNLFFLSPPSLYSFSFLILGFLMKSCSFLCFPCSCLFCDILCMISDCARSKVIVTHVYYLYGNTCHTIGHSIYHLTHEIMVNFRLR